MRRLALTVPAPHAPYLRSGWSGARVTAIQAAALALPLLAALAEAGAATLGVLAVALAVTLGWELVFAFVRGRTLTWHGLTTAMIITVMVPVTVPLWQIALVVSFGAVLGELIFGGRGFGFLNAAVAALAFLVFSFPGTSLGGNGPWVAAATLPAAVLLLVAGLISWRVMVASIAGFVVVALLGGGALAWGATGSGLAFGLVFLVCDPLGAAATNPGRWLYGVLAGGLVAVFDTAGGAEVPASALVFAALLGSIFAPLLDHLVVLASARRWRHG